MLTMVTPHLPYIYHTYHAFTMVHFLLGRPPPGTFLAGMLGKVYICSIYRFITQFIPNLTSPGFAVGIFFFYYAERENAVVISQTCFVV